MTIQTPSIYNASIAAEIRAELGRQRITQDRLAHCLQWSRTKLSRRMTSEVDFNTRELEAIAFLLNIPLSTLTSPRAASE